MTKQEPKKPYRVTQTGLKGHDVGDVIMLTERGARARVNKVEPVDAQAAAKEAEKVAQAQIDAATAEADAKSKSKSKSKPKAEAAPADEAGE